jgi:LuxR family transcriptional regulator, maltose regulon positive regulatory protein
MLLRVSSATALNPAPTGRPRGLRTAQRRAPGDRRAGRRGLPPPRPAGLVARARLLRRLLEAREVPLALLVAPAGYGKTTLLSEWAAHDPRPFEWIRLNRGHEDPDALIASIAATLGVSRSTESLVSLLNHIERMPHALVLVLDGAHAIRGADSFAVIEAIAEAMPTGSQVALSTRGEPALAVGRLRAHRKLVELRTEDLAMEPVEAAALLENVGLSISGDEVDKLVRRTEGWPAALYLAALSLRAQRDVHAAVEGFAGDDRVIADYLRDEVLAPLSTAQVNFLVRTSVLETLSASACDAVLDGEGSATRLAELDRANVPMVSLDRSGERYRHHRLFAELLRSDLRRAEPDLEAPLHRRASEWYARRGEAHAAIRHAIAADDVDAAAGVVWRHAPDRVAHGENETVTRWLGEFSAEQIAGSAPLSLVAAASWLAAGDRGQVARFTAEAASSLELDGSEASPAHHAALTILGACGDAEGLARIGADALMAAGPEPERGLWRSTGSWLDGVSHHLTGRRADARVPLEEGGRGHAVAAPSIQALCLAQLALLALEDEDWDEAAVLLGRARSQLKAGGLVDYPTVSLVFAVSALVRAHRGMADEARSDLFRSDRLLTRLVDFMPWYEVETRIVLARAALQLGDVAAARRLMTEATDRLRSTPDATTLKTWLEETRTRLEAVTRSAGETCALTQAELRVLHLLPTHLSVPAIASRLYVSPNTVKTHVRALYRKLDASSRAEAVAHASAAGLLDDAQAA